MRHSTPLYIKLVPALRGKNTTSPALIDDSVFSPTRTTSEDTIAEVLPVRISEIIEGASMEVVDTAIPDHEKVAPSITQYTAIGLVLGILISAIALFVLALTDDTIHDEEYVLRTYNYPILGRVPDLVNAGNKSYGYYSQKHQRKSI